MEKSDDKSSRTGMVDKSPRCHVTVQRVCYRRRQQLIVFLYWPMSLWHVESFQLNIGVVVHTLRAQHNASERRLSCSMMVLSKPPYLRPGRDLIKSPTGVAIGKGGPRILFIAIGPMIEEGHFVLSAENTLLFKSCNQAHFYEPGGFSPQSRLCSASDVHTPDLEPFPRILAWSTHTPL